MARKWGGILGWSVYLACSWTWCIGMYLPILLIRDYGIGGFVVFAVPNVIGATAVGWLVRDGEHSRALRAAHSSAYAWFSGITVAFHLFVFMGIGESVTFIRPHSSLMLFIIGGVVFAVATLVRYRHRLGITTAVTAATTAIATIIIATAHRQPLPTPTVGTAGISGLATACTLGFLTCPLLDRTLLHVHTRCGSGGTKLAFAVGFLVFFLAAISLTALAGPSLVAAAAGMNIFWLAVVAPYLSHFTAQGVFTCSLHIREQEQVLDAASTRSRIAVFVLVVASIFGGAFTPYLPHYAGLSAFELGYRLFLTSYALIFPAYVWVCMAPNWRTPAPPTRAQLLVAGLACLIAAPFFWMGAIERIAVWFIPGVAIVLLARLFVQPRSSDAFAS